MNGVVKNLVHFVYNNSVLHVFIKKNITWNISIFGITCGMYVFGLGLSVAQAMAAGVLGYFLSCSLVGILAVGSVRTGLPTLVQSRLAFGYHGNKVPTFFG